MHILWWPVIYGALYLFIIVIPIYLILWACLGDIMKNETVKSIFIVFVFLGSIGCSEYTYDLHHPKQTTPSIPDRFAFHEKGRFDTEGGNLNGDEYEVYIDTKTGQKYIHIQHGYNYHTFSAIIEPKELIEEDMKNVFESDKE